MAQERPGRMHAGAMVEEDRRLMIRNERGGGSREVGVCPAQHLRRATWGDGPRASLLLPPPRRRGCPCPVPSSAQVRRPPWSGPLATEGDGQLPAPHSWRHDHHVTAGRKGLQSLPGARGVGVFSGNAPERPNAGCASLAPHFFPAATVVCSDRCL